MSHLARLKRLTVADCDDFYRALDGISGQTDASCMHVLLKQLLLQTPKNENAWPSCMYISQICRCKGYFKIKISLP